MSNPDDWLVDHGDIERCPECQNECIRECILSHHVHEDVAKIRDEEIHDAVR